MTGNAMTFDKKINVGNLVSLVAVIGTAFAAWIAVQNKLTAQDVKVSHLEEQRKDDRKDVNKRLDKIDEKLDRLLESPKRGR